MVACSRLVFAMSRDGRFPAHRLMRRVGPRTRTPIPATVLVFALGVVLMVALPVAVCALVWTLIALFVLVTPKEALVSVAIVVGLLLLGGPFRRTSPHKSPTSWYTFTTDPLDHSRAGRCATTPSTAGPCCHGLRSRHARRTRRPRPRPPRQSPYLRAQGAGTG